MPRKRVNHETLYLDGLDAAIELRRSPRARRLSLRLDAAGDGVVLTLPPGVSKRQGLAFVEGHRAWLSERLAALPPRVAFTDGAVVPYLGRDHVVHHRPQARRGVWRSDGALQVSGQAEHLARRLGDFLKASARSEITARARAKAATLPAATARPLGRITLRDTTSRWGSCSAEGNLSFSWRLILAPEPVLDYVVAHEVAHLVHRNHGAAFWALVDELTPAMVDGRAWLKSQGRGLLRYG
jgi:predicted metal-dependent hydrolase